MQWGSFCCLLALAAFACIVPEAAASCLPGEYLPPPPITRFAKISDDVPAETLEAWEGYGLQDWVLGETGATCAVTCPTEDMLCRDDFDYAALQIMTPTLMITVVPVISDGALDCSAGTMARPANEATPAVILGILCFSADQVLDVVFDCNAVDDPPEGVSHQGRRICPCFPDPLKAGPPSECTACPTQFPLDGVLPPECLAACPSGTATGSAPPGCPGFCAAGTWGERGLSPCVSCAASFTSLQGAASANDCTCPLGQYSETVFAPPRPPMSLIRGIGIDSLVQQWEDFGVQDWIIGMQGQDCTSACAASEQLCSDDLDKNLFPLVDGPTMILLFDTLTDGSLTCGSATHCSSLLCPNMQFSGLAFMASICYHPDPNVVNVKFECTAPDATQFKSDRLCPCVLDPAIASEVVDSCVACPLNATAAAMLPACVLTTPPSEPPTSEPDVTVLTVFSTSGFENARIVSCPVNATSPADATSVEQCVCAPGFSPAGSTESTQDFVCIGAFGHAMQSGLMTCMHANGSVLPFVNYDTSDPTQQMPCVQVTLADCQTAAATNAFRFSVHVQSNGNATCFGVLGAETIQQVMNESHCQKFDGTEVAQSILITTHQSGGCEPCAADSYKAAAGDAACTLCGAGRRSLPGAEALEDCLCDTGFTGAACEPCAHQSYKTYVGSASCRACPGNTSQALGTLGATSLASCQCAAGHRGPDGGPCEACGANSHKPAAGPHACTGCHANSGSPPASTASAQCVCNAGYSSANQSQCAACVEGTYKNATGNQACSACPADSVTVSPNVNPDDLAAPPAMARSDCLCGPGFSGPAGGPCAACEAGFYCPGFDSGGGATQCDEHASSPAGSADDSDCVCVAGYWLSPSYLCGACPLNQYCPGDNLMYACPSNSSAPARSANETACTCDSGFVPE